MRKTVGILSRHAVSNYGSVLQAIALQEMLEQLGCSAEYIDYRISRDRPILAAYSEVGIAAPIKAFPKWIGLRRFEKMRHRYLKQSERIHSIGELTGLYSHYDALCVGSDQVWNVMSDGRIDNAYLLDGSPDTTFKFSYASSFGKNGVLPIDEERVVSALKRFDKLSLREESGVAFLRDRGLESRLDVDPVHLYGADGWEQIIGLKAPRQVTSDFILIYNLHPSERFNEYVAAVLDSNKCPAISIRPTLRKSLGKNLFFPSLAEFLWCFKNARCVLTDSFHGTSFSILFNTPFVEIMPEHYSERNRAVLERYGLSDRVNTEVGLDIFLSNEIDWASVNEKLAVNRSDSIAYLRKAVSLIV